MKAIQGETQGGVVVGTADIAERWRIRWLKSISCNLMKANVVKTVFLL